MASSARAKASSFVTAGPRESPRCVRESELGRAGGIGKLEKFREGSWVGMNVLKLWGCELFSVGESLTSLPPSFRETRGGMLYHLNSNKDQFMGVGNLTQTMEICGRVPSSNSSLAHDVSIIRQQRH
jgi:hypothetical protein